MNISKQQYICDTCDKTFSTKGNLTQHIRTNKNCLWLREQQITTVCNFCNSNISKKEYDNHIKNCIFKTKIPVILEENKKLQRENEKLEEQNFYLKDRIAFLENLRYRSKNPAVLPLTKNHISDLVKIHLNKFTSFLDSGPYGLGIAYAEHVLPNRAFCTDMARHTVYFVDESGKTIIDPGCKLLMKQFFEVGAPIIYERIKDRLEAKEEDKLNTDIAKTYKMLEKDINGIRKCRDGIFYTKGENRIEFTKKFVSGICYAIASSKSL